MVSTWVCEISIAGLASVGGSSGLMTRQLIPGVPSSGMDAAAGPGRTETPSHTTELDQVTPAAPRVSPGCRPCRTADPHSREVSVSHCPTRTNRRASESVPCELLDRDALRRPVAIMEGLGIRPSSAGAPKGHCSRTAGRLPGQEASRGTETDTLHEHTPRDQQATQPDGFAVECARPAEALHSFRGVVCRTGNPMSLPNLPTAAF